MAQTVNYRINSDSPPGTTLSWTVTGTNLAAIYTGPTSGTVTTGAGGIALLSFNLGSNNTASNASFTLTVSGGACGTVSDTVFVPTSVVPPPPNQTVCGSTVDIPWIYCGVYDGTTDALVGVSVLKTFNAWRAPSGGVNVPASVAVVNGNIVVSSTVQVQSGSSSVPGITANVLTSFNSVSKVNPLITGTTTTVRGYY